MYRKDIFTTYCYIIIRIKVNLFLMSDNTNCQWACGDAQYLIHCLWDKTPLGSVLAVSSEVEERYFY